MKQWILMLVAALGLNGCTNLMELQAPKVSVTSVRPVAGKGLLPNFEIDLHLRDDRHRLCGLALYPQLIRLHLGRALPG